MLSLRFKIKQNINIITSVLFLKSHHRYRYLIAFPCTYITITTEDVFIKRKKTISNFSEFSLKRFIYNEDLCTYFNLSYSNSVFKCT